ncbi:sensor histidine kinase [Roseisolibacter agri]|uniref:histidine kinase n=1 Tax=Roseisolibacter agri TaxID=2014610 RepID=A0AA37Q1N9_9BACT|nr:hybrid sensor histidine kinase/response regulator [Roseisolibacter agri]GLC24729.1 hypothetical protein rosag_12420 [Roseisolibacter agri]
MSGAVAMRATDDARRARLRACTILLVDDEEANLDLLEALLNDEGYVHLVRTQDPRTVPALVAAHAPDLVLLDLHMPHRHGLDVLADLQAATPPWDYRPVLVLTADATWEARERALACGARDFVTKPFEATEVLLRVENLLEARTLHAAERAGRERVSLLAAWSGLLAASMDPATALAQLPHLLVPRWARACEVLAPDVPPPDDAHSAPVADAERVVATIVAHDAVDGALVDELAARAGLAAEHARLLAAAELATRERERLLAVVAHDLRNPLGAVALYAEMLGSLQPDVGDAYVRGALATIHSSTVGMQRLVEDLLDASTLRGDALRIVRADVRAGAVFDEAERMLRPMAEARGLALTVAADDGAAERVVAVDGPRVVQLLSNLVGNAVKFTPPGGAVTVRYAVTDDALTASVADTGAGIDADDLPHLFTAFWRRDRRDPQGAGLGLWIARAVAEAHDGTLRVASRPGHGTTFHLAVPLVARPARRRED